MRSSVSMKETFEVRLEPVSSTRSNVKVSPADRLPNPWYPYNITLSIVHPFPTGQTRFRARIITIRGMPGGLGYANGVQMSRAPSNDFRARYGIRSRFRFLGG